MIEVAFLVAVVVLSAVVWSQRDHVQHMKLGMFRVEFERTRGRQQLPGPADGQRERHGCAGLTSARDEQAPAQR